MIRRLVLAALLVLGGATVARAEIYRWIDAQGNAHYTDGIENVPARYRAKAVPLGLRSQPPPAPPPAAPAAKTPSAPARTGGTTIRLTPDGPTLISVTVNGKRTARVRFDREAPGSALTARVLEEAGVPAPTGTVTLESLQIGSARVTAFPVTVTEGTGGDHDGVLGRDFVEKFTVTESDGYVTLTAKQ